MMVKSTKTFVHFKLFNIYIANFINKLLYYFVPIQICPLNLVHELQNQKNMLPKTSLGGQIKMQTKEYLKLNCEKGL